MQSMKMIIDILSMNRGLETTDNYLVIISNKKCW